MKRVSLSKFRAVTAALIGLCYLAGQHEAVGDEEGGQIILPVNPQCREVER